MARHRDLLPQRPALSGRPVAVDDGDPLALVHAVSAQRGYRRRRSGRRRPCTSARAGRRFSWLPGIVLGRRITPFLSLPIEPLRILFGRCTIGAVSLQQSLRHSNVGGVVRIFDRDAAARIGRLGASRRVRRPGSRQPLVRSDRQRAASNGHERSEPSRRRKSPFPLKTSVLFGRADRIEQFEPPPRDRRSASLVRSAPEQRSSEGMTGESPLSRARASLRECRSDTSSRCRRLARRSVCVADEAVPFSGCRRTSSRLRNTFLAVGSIRRRRTAFERPSQRGGLSKRERS